MEKNDFFDACFEHLLTESMIPFLIRIGAINMVQLSLAMAVKMGEYYERGEFNTEKVITELEADTYNQMLAVTRAMFTDEDRANFKNSIKAAREYAEKQLDKMRQANAAKMN